MSRFRSLLCLVVLLAGGLRAEPRELAIDPAKTGAPINPFIYGQFIEHLGRCIYGGIWAEMLEDRKFFFPVTAEYAPYRGLTDTAYPVVGASPWQIIGAADGVAMKKDQPFVGDHTPELKAGIGLRQRDLAVLAGKEYVGYVWAKPVGTQPLELEVALVWGDGASDRAATKLVFPAGDYSKQAFRFRAGKGSEHAMLELRVAQAARIGTASLMPADNVKGMRADTLALLKRLGGTIYRWPGGNFVSGYEWRDGIGDRDRRPPRQNPAWTGVEHNDFGTDEFIAFCREIGTEPMIAVNTGFGDPHSAAQWVQYCNGAASTLAGGWRQANGSATPYAVKYWCVGNEMFGPWQLGFMQLHHYTEKHNRVAKAMWQVDPSAVLVGVGDIEQINKENDPEQVKRGIPWSQGMLESSADWMNMLSEHFYRGRVPWETAPSPELLTHVRLIKEGVRRKADAHRKLQPSLPQLKGRTMPIAMDEWNYWHREYVYGELGCIYDLADGLGIAEGLHEYFRQSDLIQMAHYAQTVNVIGAIKTSKTAAEMETTGLVLELYRHRFGNLPLVLGQDFGDIDVAAALRDEGRVLTVGVVNPNAQPAEFKLALPSGAAPRAGATRWHITGPNAAAHNSPGKPAQVDIQRTDSIDPSQALVVPALSCAVFEIRLK